ncbi:hypothetical protein CLPUN_38480 [Clostridium puniceum]|uniref:Uncharacterized protein n=1 Tax=Clostridium puniceum TaxID=29367 RepID=A0A1S8T9P0_9CLOT|nr:hypothetical protein CLPUN_38480 [Clostridium puniceum]
MKIIEIWNKIIEEWNGTFIIAETKELFYGFSWETTA